MFLKLELFPSSGERMETPTLVGLLERANFRHRQVISVTLPEYRSRFSFRNVVFSSCLEFRTMKNVHIILSLWETWRSPLMAVCKVGFVNTST
jgi:hypothetical protein